MYVCMCVCVYVCVAQYGGNANPIRVRENKVCSTYSMELIVGRCLLRLLRLKTHVRVAL